MSILNVLLKSNEPVVRLKTYRKVLNYVYDDKEVRDIVKDLKTTSRIIKSLFDYSPINKKTKTYHVYKKWQGIHWILADLADIEYPPGDQVLITSRDFELAWLFSEKRWKRKEIIKGKKRFCASQEGNGLFSILKIRLDDHNFTHKLAERLITYQWDDGGWNCDINPAAIHSSYHESLIPMRALNLYWQVYHDSESKQAIDRAAELFLKRRLYQKEAITKIIDDYWIKLFYSPYWHYNILSALKVMTESNKITDPRCKPALDLLKSKMLSNGGFPAEMKYYNTKGKAILSPVDWGGVNKQKMNEWVTIDTLFVLKSARLIDIAY